MDNGSVTNGGAVAPQQPSFTPEHLEQLEAATRRRFWIHAAALYTSAIALAAFTFLLYPSSARAELRVEALAGQCKQSKIGNGIWYQEQYPHQLDFSSSCANLGLSVLTASRGPWSFGWRLAYVDLGKMRFDSIFTMRDDEQHQLHEGSNCDPSTMSGCLGHGRGEQRARGMSAGLLAERIVGPLVLGADLGLFLYEGRFRVSIDGQGASSNVGLHQFDWRGYRATPYIGLTARYGDLMLMARRYSQVSAQEPNCNGCSGFANGHATQISIGISVAF